uniref:TRAP transporter substrate-binding protein n=1 Tax=candidate division WOR-3 bacterium TaxID=2052148 RepID=A0A7C2K4N6_UNCW3
MVKNKKGGGVIMGKRGKFTFVFGFVLALILPLWVQAQEFKPVVLKMVDFRPDIWPGNIWPRMFVEKVSKVSKGEIQIKFIGGPEAIPASDSAAAAQKGVVDIASTMGVYTPVKVAEVLGYCEYSSYELRQRGMWKLFQDLYSKHGLYFLGASTPSEPQVQVTFFFGKGKCINTLADFKGKRIASVGGSMRAYIEALGSTCVPMQFTDYFTAMERKVVDGYLSGTPAIIDFGLTPVTECLLDEPVSSCGSFFVMNLDRWNSLPKRLQDMLIQAAIETEIDGAKAFTEVLEEVKKKISAEGVKIVKLPKEDSVKLYVTYREAMWREAYTKYPRELIDKIREIGTNPDFYRFKK